VSESQAMTWKSIDCQADLDELDRVVCWEDSRVLEYLASSAPRPYCPTDVSRSGYEHKDIHVLLDACSSTLPFLELVFIHCDWIGANAFERLCLQGRVDTLRRVELSTEDGDVLVRCGRLLYRWLAEASTTGDFYHGSLRGDPDGSP
jgi:hypothetical protein